jgi:hypothetical protein
MSGCQKSYLGDRGHQRLQLAGSPKLTIPRHDPAVFARFPKVNDRVVKIE